LFSPVANRKTFNDVLHLNANMILQQQYQGNQEKHITSSIAQELV